ncbi:MAG: FtsW/RodA/SpoVE family cell cycle protein [Bacteroidota bacterium]|nr:FtsW/RodA/SpoVE family cell cycle protein [Bacteroidota bacterium]
MNAGSLHLKEFIKGDRLIWTIIFMLTIYSLLAVYSASGGMSVYQNGINTFFLAKHIPYIILGLTFTWLVSKLHYTELNKWAPVLLVVATILLIWTLMFGVNINQAKRWIQLPFLDITIQVSDFAKIALICYVARAISARQDSIKSIKSGLMPLLIPVVLICGLIAPANFSTAALLFTTCLMMLFVGRVSIAALVGLLGLGVGMFLVLIFLADYFPDSIRATTWLTRIQEFITNDEGGYQIQQAKIAIANGNWIGVGPGNSVLRNFIPYVYADFIFAIIVEEMGIIFGGIGLISLYLLLLWHCVGIVSRTPKAFGALLTIGIGLNIILQAFANMAVSLELVPVTGLTLPLVSMGGSSLLFTSISFGMIISVSKHINELNLENDENSEMNSENLQDEYND